MKTKHLNYPQLDNGIAPFTSCPETKAMEEQVPGAQVDLTGNLTCYYWVLFCGEKRLQVPGHCDGKIQVATPTFTFEQVKETKILTKLYLRSV